MRLQVLDCSATSVTSMSDHGPDRNSVFAPFFALLLQRIPHLKPPSKKLPGPVPLLRIDSCSRLGFKPICGFWPPAQHFLHGQVT